MIKHFKKPYWTAALLSAFPTVSIATNVDVERENIVIFSRQGDSQLTEAINQLKQLYARTSDSKVRDDLIALLMKQSRFEEVASLCEHCQLSKLNENELENLGRATRNIKRFDRSLSIYQTLNRRFPNNPNGALGSALVSTDMGKFESAKSYLNSYQKRFGQHQGYQDALTYLNTSSEGDVAKIGRLQNELAHPPENKEIALQLYRLSAKYQLIPLKNTLAQKYPELLNSNDVHWKDYDNAISLSKGEGAGKAQLERSYDELKKLSETLNKENPLYTKSLQDRLVIAVRLNKLDDVESIYTELKQQTDSQLPNYVEESYADYQLAIGSPFKALNIYKKLEKDQLSQNKEVSSELLMKLVYASSDAGYFSEAKQYLDKIKVEPYILDFTRSHRIENPFVDRVYYTNIHLNNWRGKRSQSLALINERLNDKSPGDPQVMIERSEFERTRNNTDDALYWTKRAQAFLPSENHISARSQFAQIALTNGDFKQASHIINGFSDKEKQDQKSLIENYESSRAGYITGSYGISHRTSLNSDGQSNFGNEVNQEYYLYSPKTEEGHYLYGHYIDTKSPNDKFQYNFRLQRIGIGGKFNFYPFSLNVESGKNLKLSEKTFEQNQLKNKSYIIANLDYRLNQNWHFNLNVARNGNTPVRAIYQNIYTKEVGGSILYTQADLFSIGSSINVMKFDDGNLRKSTSLWGNIESFSYDRWRINNSLRFDYMRNSRNDSNVWYYNPQNSRSFESGIDVAYTQPFNYRLNLTQHFRGTIGHHWQSGITDATQSIGKSSEKTWAISYGHDWRIGKKVGLSYEIGRKRNVYDGESEYNNFGNLNFSVSF